MRAEYTLGQRVVKWTDEAVIRLLRPRAINEPRNLLPRYPWRSSKHYTAFLQTASICGLDAWPPLLECTLNVRVISIPTPIKHLAQVWNFQRPSLTWPCCSTWIASRTTTITNISSRSSQTPFQNQELWQNVRETRLMHAANHSARVLNPSRETRLLHVTSARVLNPSYNTSNNRCKITNL